jgi:hypothetical protein
LQFEQDLLKLKDAVATLHVLSGGANDEFLNALSTIKSLDASRLSDQDLSYPLEATRPCRRGPGDDCRTVFEHGPAGAVEEGSITTGSGGALTTAARRAAIEILTARVTTHERPSKAHEASKLLAAEQRLQRFFQTHLLRDLTAVLATVHCDREFRVRKLVDDRMIDAHDEEENEEDDDNQKSPDERNEIDAARDDPIFPFAFPTRELGQSMPRVNVLELQAALSARPHEEDVITTGDEEDELEEITEH